MSKHAARELLSAYLDSELDERDLVAVREHLGDCSACRDVYEGLSRVSIGLRQVAREPVPVEVGVVVRRRIGQFRSRPGLSERFEDFLGDISMQTRLAPVFALVMALAVILYIFSQGVARQERARVPIIVGPFAAPTVKLEERSPAAEEEAVGMRAAESKLAAAPERWLGDRRFLWLDGIWFEEGVESSEIALVVQFDDPALAEGMRLDLAQFEELGEKVRLRYRDQVIEVLFDGTGTGIGPQQD